MSNGDVSMSDLIFSDVTSYTFASSGQDNASVEPPTSETSPTVAEGCLVIQFLGSLPWENPLDVVSPETEQLVDRIKAAIVVPVVVMAGCPANCVNMAVFFKLGLKERINTCLFVLSLVDLLYLIFAFVLYGERSFALSASHPRYGPVFRFAIEHHFYGFYGIAWASAFVSVVIASERCFCIYFPLRSQTIIKTKTMAIFLALSCLVITFGFYIAGEKYTMVCIYDRGRTILFWQMATTTSYYVRHKQMVDIFDGTVYGFFLPAVFNVTVASCSIAMFVKLKKTVAWRDKTSSAVSSKETVLTKMLICLSIQYNAFSAPNFFFRTSTLFVSELTETGKYFNVSLLMISVSEIMSYLNSSFPFFVYYFVGSKYRETLHRMFPRKRGMHFQQHNLLQHGH